MHLQLPNSLKTEDVGKSTEKSNSCSGLQQARTNLMGNFENLEKNKTCHLQ